MEKMFTYLFNQGKVIFLNKSIRKIFILLLVITAVITSTAPSITADAVNMPYVIYETKNSDYIGSGILYENIKKFTTNGWLHINVVRVDLNDEFAEIGGLFNNKGLSNRDSISNMVTDNKAVAGINGDFFEFNPFSYSMGTFIEKGEVLSSPIERAYALPTFYLDIENNPDITFFDRSMSLTSLNSGKSVPISLINKAADMNMVTLLNKHWGTKSFGNKFNGKPIVEPNGEANGEINGEANGEANNVYNGEMVEMVVVDNVVQEIRIGKESVNIPENGYVIAVRGNRAEPLLANFNVGDEVKLSIGTTPNLENIKFAIGGGSIILKDGKITNSNIDIKGRHPRTGIGITEDRNELIIATIDGRDTSYKGVSQEEFAAILKGLGAYNALNLDGGGSTTMAIKPIDQQVAKVVNKPSEGGERRVVNGVGVFSNAPKGELSYIKLNTDETKMFPNTSRRFTVKGYDQYHNPVEIDQSKVEYTFDGVDGEIEGNVFRAKSTGNVTISANYQSISSTLNLKVLDEIKSIIFPVNKFTLHVNDQKNIGTIYGKDKNGFKAKIYNEDIDWSVIGDIGYIEKGVFYSGEKIGAGAITGRVGNSINNILVSIGSGEGIPIEGFEKIENFNITNYPEYVKGEISLNAIAKEGQNSMSLRYDFTQGDGTRASYILFTPEGKKGLALKGTPNKLSLWVKGDSNGAWLRGIVKDSNGKDHYIDFKKSLDSTDWQYVEGIIPSNVAYPITLDRIYIVEIDSSKKYSGEILVDNLMIHYPPNYDNVEVPTPSSFKDGKNIKSEKTGNGFSFVITRLPNNLQEIAGQAAVDKIRNIANPHNLSMFIGKTSGEFNSTVKSDRVVNLGTPYKTNRYRNLMIIDASSAKGGIRDTNPQQWLWLKDGLANAEEDHILLFLNTPIFGAGGFKDRLEADLLHNTLVETSEKGKSIWVIYNGNTTKTDLIDGIRYIELNNKKIETPEDVKNIYSIEFVVNGKDITYQITN
ncbi:hypothetical protein C3E90_04045 [Clostridium sp. Cult2]|nr:hypothetical protein [Clostridium sp. Cult2]